MGRARVGALALPRCRTGPRPLPAPYRQGSQAHPRREPVRRAHRCHPAAGPCPRRRDGRRGAVPLLRPSSTEPS
ncbi:hypothetical protein ACRAWF_25225 [Streptomyces sp. L7]